MQPTSPRPLTRWRPPLAGLFTALALPAWALDDPPPAPNSAQNVVVLTTTASVDVAKDWLSVVFSTSREATDAAVVQAQLRQALEAALTVARKQARPGQLEVQTGAFSLQPRYAPPPRPGAANNAPAVIAWQGSAELIVEGRDIQAISALTGQVRTLSIASVGFSLSREARERVESEVTAQAIDRFRARAEAVARAFGFSGYSLREVTLSSELPGPVSPRFKTMAAMAPAPGDDSLPLEAGKATLSVTVSGGVQLK